ncbi:hypothetical protein KAU51_03220 [Candidatus Parcubacteria bacterium]|nr:hypothetical protein [Candidatus Parcubacteria bacterium]
MTKTGQKFIFIFFFAALLILFCSSFCLAERDLEIEYPGIGGEAPTGETKLPGYIKYIFNFAVMLGGILAFAVMVYGGIVYLISAGDPTKISDAKSRILSGIIGLVLLLLCYLILTTINPELAILKEMEPLKPVNGVYLINNEDEKRYYASSIPSIKDFDVVSIEFISPPEELYSVFAYTEEGYKGNVTEIENSGTGSTDSTSGKSFFFLWNRPGVYLYKETGFGSSTRHPLYLSGSAANLDIWDNNTQSLKINHVNEEIAKGVVLFTEPNFTHLCGIVLPEEIAMEDTPLPNVTEISDFSKPLPFPSSNITIGNNNLSSVYVFTVDLSKDVSGNVVFYDSLDCKGSKFTVEREIGSVMAVASLEGHTFEEGELAGESADKRIKSFEINGPYVVVIMTVPLGEEKDEEGRPRICQLFEKPSYTNCYSTIKGEDVYDPNPDGVKPRAYFIINVE